MEKRILLVSLWGNRNYGNKLQSYAAVQLLKNIGCSVVIAKHNEPFSVRERIHRLKFLLLPIGNNYKYRYIKRASSFFKFNKKYINESIYIRNFKIRKRHIRSIDYAVTGSDQVWHNWFDLNDEINYYFLRFLPKEKRIAFAASFGFDNIPEKYHLIYHSCINEMKRISVREESAKRIIDKEGRKDAIVISDPTLCLEREEWKSIEKRPPKAPNGKFMLAFFLGELPDSYNEIIDKISQKYKINEKIYMNSIESVFFSSTPEEYLWLIDNAEYICTDSYHATVFSIIFEKKFIVFHRIEKGFTGMFDRIRTLLKMTGLESREYCSKWQLDEPEHINYDIAKEKICIERVKAIDFLKESIYS